MAIVTTGHDRASQSDPAETRWDAYYEAAKQYYHAFGHLDVPTNYQAEGNLRLGRWLYLQRRIERSDGVDPLTDEKKKKLDEIGMIWSSRTERAWDKNISYARDYYSTFGHLDVPSSYISPGGFELGKWIIAIRQNGKTPGKSKLPDEKIKKLNGMGMIWNKQDYSFERNFNEAKRYYEQHGNLDVPNLYVTESGIQLGRWIHNLRSAEKNSFRTKLSNERIRRLESIGMRWEGTKETQWDRHYNEAKNYYRKHGRLDIPKDYVSDSGIKLGQWISRQRAAKDGKHRMAKLTDDQIELLDKIGMVWDGTDQWEQKYAWVCAYEREHGNCNIPARYYREECGWLGAWLKDQEKKYTQGKLSDTQLQKLAALNVKWLCATKKADKEKGYSQAAIPSQQGQMLGM